VAEDAAVAVLALARRRYPRPVASLACPTAMIEGIMDAPSGHGQGADRPLRPGQVLEALGVDFIDSPG
jgi:hypothetical protein